MLDFVVNESVRRQTGARGLASILTRHIESAAFDVFAEPPAAGAGSAGLAGEVRLELREGEIEVRVG